MYYVVPADDAKALIDSYKDKVNSEEKINEIYLDPNNKLRAEGDKKHFISNGDIIEIYEGSTQFQSVFDNFISAGKLELAYTQYLLGGTIKINIYEKPMSIAFIYIGGSAPNPNIPHCNLDEYKYFKRRIGISGGPSSGKTSVAQQLSLKLNIDYKANSSTVVEYATSFIQKQGRIPTLQDQIWLYVKQKEREEIVNKTTNFVISDSPIWLQYIYALRCMHKTEHTPVTEHTLGLFSRYAAEALNLYDFNIILNPVVYEENGVRFHNMEQSKEISDKCIEFLKDNGYTFKAYTYTQVDRMVSDFLYEAPFAKVQTLVVSHLG